jgi:flagellar protein FlaJ
MLMAKPPKEDVKGPGEVPIKKAGRRIIRPGEAQKSELEEKAEKLKAKRTKEEVTRLGFLAGSIIGGMVFFIIAMIGLSFEAGGVQFDAIAWIMIGIMVLIGPFGFYESRRNDKILRLEERLSDFLRDLAESNRSGQTLHEAIRTGSQGDYGELTPEIRKMAIQISWGVNAADALERFAGRVKTPLVRRAVTLIIEASAAGGDVGKVLDAAANDTKEIQLLQRERQVQMSLYVAVIFVSFVVFLVVILIVYVTFVPQMKELAEAYKSSGGDESGATSSISGLQPGNVDFDEIKFIYISAGLVHGIGDGLVAGLMGSGKMTDGLKLSFFMVMIIFIIFVLMAPVMGV